MRINKYIAQAGYASRRVADELILAGKVKVNGALMDTPGYDVQDNDLVEVEGHIIAGAEKLVYYVLNKPVGYITTTRDEQGRPTVMSLMEDVPVRVFPVGRLDYNTSGLLIMTNDGQLAQHIAHPSGQVWKSYLALVAGTVSPEEAARMRRGVEIDGYKTKPAKVDILEARAGLTRLKIQICEGRNRQVRKMCEAVGHRVLELQRTAVGQVQLGHIKEGRYRKLNPDEVAYLKNC